MTYINIPTVELLREAALRLLAMGGYVKTAAELVAVADSLSCKDCGGTKHRCSNYV